MKTKRIFCAVAAAILLCACQASTEPQDIVEDPPAVEQSEHEAPSADDSAEENEAEKEEEFSLYPPAPPVCELDFTETESFPLPFEDELLFSEDETAGFLLSGGQALYDYDTMWQLLEENYSYLEAIKREMGIDWEEVKAKYRQDLEGHNYISQFYFLRKINDCLREFKSVGHLFLVTPQARLNLLGLKNSERVLSQNIFKIVNNPKSTRFYEYASLFPNPYSDRTNTDSAEDESVSIDGLTAITSYLFTGYAEGEVPYLKIESFTQWDDAAQAQLEEFFLSISQEEHLIIDVRGNGGGSDGAWIYGIVPFLAKAQQKYEFDQFRAAKSGTLNLTLEPEFDKSRGYITRYTDDSWQKDFPYISPDMLTGLDILIKVPGTVIGTNGPDRFHGKIWVLVDNYCYSATEYFVCFCKDSGFATLVGTRTGGSGKGFAPHYMALPYSGLIVEYEPSVGFNTDGTYNGISGTVPDIVPEEGRGALETCLMAIDGTL